jgi:hypothetical protein
VTILPLAFYYGLWFLVAVIGLVSLPIIPLTAEQYATQIHQSLNVAWILPELDRRVIAERTRLTYEIELLLARMFPLQTVCRWINGYVEENLIGTNVNIIVVVSVHFRRHRTGKDAPLQSALNVIDRGDQRLGERLAKHEAVLDKLFELVPSLASYDEFVPTASTVTSPTPASPPQPHKHPPPHHEHHAASSSTAAASQTAVKVDFYTHSPTSRHLKPHHPPAPPPAIVVSLHDVHAGDSTANSTANGGADAPKSSAVDEPERRDDDRHHRQPHRVESLLGDAATVARSVSRRASTDKHRIEQAVALASQRVVETAHNPHVRESLQAAKYVEYCLVGIRCVATELFVMMPSERMSASYHARQPISLRRDSRRQVCRYQIRRSTRRCQRRHRVDNSDQRRWTSEQIFNSIDNDDDDIVVVVVVARDQVGVAPSRCDEAGGDIRHARAQRAARRHRARSSCQRRC